MKWYLILIVLFSVGAVVDWNTDKEYSVVDGTSTIEYRPPTKQEIFDRELNTNIINVVTYHTSIGQDWYNDRGRKYAYKLPDTNISKIQIGQIDLLMKTTFYDVGITTGTER